MGSWSTERPEQLSEVMDHERIRTRTAQPGWEAPAAWETARELAAASVSANTRRTYKALLPDRLYGEHLVHPTDFVAWFILVVLLAVIFMRLAGIPGEALLDNPTVSVVANGVVLAGLIGLIGWHVSRSMQTAFGIRGAGLWTRTAAVAAGLAGLLYG